MKTVSREFVEQLIDFAPGDEEQQKGFAHLQTEGTVAVFNMLARNRCAYLADEVGMGKTYVALGVMSLLRYFDPHARIVVIAPRENIQRKWVKELQNFVRLNWKVVGNRVKSLQGGPAWEPVVAGSLLEFAHEALLNADRDFFLRMTSFSLALKDPDARKKLRRRLTKLAPWVGRGQMPNHTAEGFRDAFGQVLNAVVPEADLLIVDEAHNLKHGFGKRVSTRNRMLGLAFGRPVTPVGTRPWYGPRAKRVLFLSATPFEEDYAAIQRQFDIFGFGKAKLRDAHNGDPLSMEALADPEVGEEEKRRLLGRLLVRRVSGLRIAGELYTKNMYRREWRKGGYHRHDEPMAITDPRQRLVVALMQKKVAEVLQHERFNNHFQIGMLSSFESFLQTAGTAARTRGANRSETDLAEEGSAFDGEEQIRRSTTEERQGIDTDAIRALVDSYRRRFGRSLPHPKLDTTSEALETAFDTGEKTLVFVRRIATVDELAAKLDEAFDRWIRNKMESAVPGLRTEIADLFARYARERSRRPGDLLESAPVDDEEPELEEALEMRGSSGEEDEGGAETFFAWFYRGRGPRGMLSGAAFQKNRLSSTSAVHATLFEDDLAAWLLGRPENPLSALVERIGQSEELVTDSLRRRAYGYFKEHSQREKGYPRLYVFDAYQVAALSLLAGTGGVIGEHAEAVLQLRYPEHSTVEQAPPPGFPGPGEAIGLTTFFTELVKRPDLRALLWPGEEGGDFRERFRRREQRRELLSAMARLGASYIDLYLLAIGQIGSFKLGPRSANERTGETAPGENLAGAFVNLLDKQRHEPGLHAFRELSNAAETFDILQSVNFPEVPGAPLWEVARIYGHTLQRQVPVGRMSGGVNKRLVRQFRMPGFPLVLVTTDVLQEGEDLHTFCRRVSHYGISWTPSAIEQRTGRIDRIGGLVQRQLDGNPRQPNPDELIQVYYPHLSDTVEVLQVRRVLRRLNRFLSLIHRTGGHGEEVETSTIDTARAILEETEYASPLEGRLQSAFPVARVWLDGDLGSADVDLPDPQPLFDHLDALWRQLPGRVEALRCFQSGSPRIREGALKMPFGLPRDEAGSDRPEGEQRFILSLRSQTAGDATLLRCVSCVGELDLRIDAVLDGLYDLQLELGQAGVCARPVGKQGLDEVSVEGDILFHPGTTQLEELEALVLRVTGTAAALKQEFFASGH